MRGDDVNQGDEALPRSGTAVFVLKSLLVLSIATLPACMTVSKGRGNYDAGYTERGYASWYGGYFHGRPTASGAIYDQFGMTAAHRRLPLGSVVRVTNPENGRAVVVVINDRGPFIKGRVIDLSYGAAKQLGAVRQGTLPVLIEVVRMGRRGAISPFVRMTGLDGEDGVAVGGRALQVTQSRDPRDGDAWLSEVKGVALRAVRGPRDVFRTPPRSRKSTV
jgi:rare lipoprotein A